MIEHLERDISPDRNQAAPTVYNRTTARLSSPDHPMISCWVSGAPNDLEQRRRAVAVPEKPPTDLSACDRRGLSGQQPAHRVSTRFQHERVHSTAQHTRLKPRNEKLKMEELLPGVLGSAPTQFFRAEGSAVGAVLFIGKRRWDEQVADLQQIGETSLLGRSGRRVSGERGLSRPGLR